MKEHPIDHEDLLKYMRASRELMHSIENEKQKQLVKDFIFATLGLVRTFISTKTYNSVMIVLEKDKENEE